MGSCWPPSSLVVVCFLPGQFTRGVVYSHEKDWLILAISGEHWAGGWADVDSRDGAPEVWVAIGARLVDPSSREVVAHASFEHRERAKGNDIPQIVLAFDEALGVVMKDIVLWTLRDPALSAKGHQL